MRGPGAQGEIVRRGATVHRHRRGKPDPTGLDEDVHGDVLQQCVHDDQLPPPSKA